MGTKDFMTGVFYMLLSATGLSIVGLFGKLAEEDMSLSALVFFRFFSAFIVCFLFYACIGRLKKDFNSYPIKSNLLRVFLVLGAQYSFYYYIQKSSLMNGMALLNTGPLFIPFYEKIFLGRRIGRSTWISIVVSFIGVMLILQPDSGIFSIAGLIGLSAGLFQAGSQMIFGVNARGENIELSVLVIFALCATVSFFPFILLPNIASAPSFESPYILFLIGGLAVGSILNQLYRAEAYKYSTPSRLASFLYFSVVMAGLYDWIIFKSPPNLLSCIGAVLVILGGILKIVLRHKILTAQDKKIPPV